MAAAAGTVGAAAAASAFAYNRENYMYDAEFRWERFCSGREYANQQAEQYRGDLRNLTALTVKKCTLWIVTATLSMALCVALYCAGRLGLHGPSPQGWLMGLWMTNNAGAFGFMALCIFLSLHASFRAQAASTHLLTRKTRVPVPTMRQLDQARKFASEFEQQGVSDILRMPFVSNNGAPKTDDAVYDDSDEEPAGAKRSRSAPSGRRRQSSTCSSWVREEFEQDRSLAGERALPEDAAPEHFRLYAAVQKEFYQYDIYARICIFMGFNAYVHSLCYYGLGHINIELRAFWVAYACVFVLAVLHVLILRFDIIPANKSKKQYLPGCEYLGPLAVFPAAVAMSMDFQVQFDRTSIAFSWILVFVAYILELIYALRLLEIVVPDDRFAGVGERLGAAWLPQTWRMVPSAFYHVLYFVAPPDKLQPGQHDIVREIKAGGAGAFDEVSGSDARQGFQTAGKEAYDYQKAMPAFAHKRHVEPWKLVTAEVAMMCAMWVFLIAGTLVDVVLGDQALVTAPHWSRPPMTRLSLKPYDQGTPLGFPWPAGSKPYLPEQLAWHEEKSHVETTNAGRRRLEALVGDHQLSGAGFSAALQGLLSVMPSADTGAALQGTAEQVNWPGFFEPRMIACGPAQDAAGSSLIAALTPHGFGALAKIGVHRPADAETFKLTGVTHLSPLLGASWDFVGDGLLLVSQNGHLVSCPGPRPPSGGLWTCGEVAGMPLAVPVAEGMRLLAITTAFLSGIGGAGGAPRLHVALVHESMPDLVVLFVQEAESWLPLGEIVVPHGQSSHATKTSLGFLSGGDLLVTTGEGHVLRRRLRDGAVVASAMHALGSSPVSGQDVAWQAACGLRIGGGSALAHLRLHKATGAEGWRPEVATMELPNGDAAAAGAGRRASLE